MDDKNIKEKSITNAILKYLRSLDNCFYWKEHGGMYGTAGIPDIICCLDGRFIGIEVKRPDGKVSRLQEVTLRKIEEASGIAIVAYSVDDVKATVDKLK